MIRNSDNQDWLIAFFLVLAVAYVCVKMIFGKYWRKYRRAMLYSQEAQKLIYEKNVLLLQAAVSLNVLAAFSIGLFVYLFLTHFDLIAQLPENFYGWALTTLTVIVIAGAKYFIIGILGKSGNNTEASIQINHQWLINHKNFGFFLLPFSAASAFLLHPIDELALYIGMALLVIMLIMNYVKGFMFLLQHRISIYYGILYLCTLEILPILIIWKVICFLRE